VWWLCAGCAQLVCGWHIKRSFLDCSSCSPHACICNACPSTAQCFLNPVGRGNKVAYGLYLFCIGDDNDKFTFPLWKKIIAGGISGCIGAAIANPTGGASRRSAHVHDLCLLAEL
jgi:hypothetical protein